MPAWQVLGVSATQNRFEALRATTTPLIGRDEEIALLMRRWEQAKGSDGQVVLMTGEPGIGKSRIAQTVVERIRAEPHTRLGYFLLAPPPGQRTLSEHRAARTCGRVRTRRKA